MNSKQLDIIRKNMKTIKKLLQSKWSIVITLSLVTAIILMLTLNFALKNGQVNVARENIRQMTRVQMLAERNAHIQQMRKEKSEATVETVVEVAASASGAVQETAKTDDQAPQEESLLPDAEILNTMENPELNLAAADSGEGFVAETIVNEPVNEEPVIEEPAYEEPAPEENNDYVAQDASADYYTSGDLRFLGEIYSGGWRWTWYSQNVLPGGGLNIPGRYVDENGYVCDENGRICLASEDLPYGTVVATPFGKEGCVYDCGCDYGTLDVYVDF